MALTIILLSAALVVASAVQPLGTSQLISLAKVEPEQAFNLWAAQVNKDYVSSQDRDKAFGTFLINARFVEEQQALHPELQLSLNEFADLTWEQFSGTRLGFKPELKEKLSSDNAAADVGPIPGFMYENSEVPESIDWRAKGAVTDVKNQGQCGSCWAFSTVGSIEGINAIKTGQLLALSEQELVDCDTEKDMGCSGGLMDYAFQYVVKNGGIDTEEDYSYWSGWGMSFWTCNKRKEHDRTAVTIDGYQDVPQDEASLLKAVANQPIAVGICATYIMQFYSGGVLDKCCTEMNHGVLVAGYGKSDKGDAYWLVKNSWGAAWGEKGYFRLKIGGGENKEGLCGIAKAASFPVKTKPNPPVPLMCDVFGWTECPASSSCSCSFSFFGLFCVWHDCCPLENGVSCDDMHHCCPAGTTCDSRQQSCVSEDGSKPSVPWTPKQKAKEQPKEVILAEVRDAGSMAARKAGKTAAHDSSRSDVVGHAVGDRGDRMQKMVPQ